MYIGMYIYQDLCCILLLLAVETSDDNSLAQICYVKYLMVCRGRAGSVGVAWLLFDSREKVEGGGGYFSALSTPFKWAAATRQKLFHNGSTQKPKAKYAAKNRKSHSILPHLLLLFLFFLLIFWQIFINCYLFLLHKKKPKDDGDAAKLRAIFCCCCCYCCSCCFLLC